MPKSVVSLGRPARSSSNATEVVSIRLTKEEKAKLDHFVFCYEQSRSELVRSCLDLFSYI